MVRFVDWLQLRVCTTNWSVLPAPLWFLIASPLLAWAMGGRAFRWPVGAARTPFSRSFWCVGWEAPAPADNFDLDAWGGF